MIFKLTALILIFFSITQSLGLYSLNWFLAIAGAFIILCIPVFQPSAIPKLEKNVQKNILLVSFFILLFFSTIFYGGLYQIRTSFNIPLLISFALIAYLFFCYVVRKSTASLGIVLAVFTFLSIWTIRYSPNPIVDTIVVLSEAPRIFISGFNPYDSTYTKVYPTIEPNYYNYLPFSFVFMTPFVILFNDPRFTAIAVELLTAYLLYLLLEKSKSEDLRVLFISVFLFLPRWAYMLEHLYLDPIIFGFFIFSLYAFLRSKYKGLPYLMFSLFLGFKQPPFLSLPFLLQAKNFRINFFKPFSILFFALPFLLSPFYFFWNRTAFLNNVVFGLSPNHITSPIERSMTLPTFLKQTFHIGANSHVYLICFIIFVFTYLALFRSKASLTLKIAFSFFCFNLFTYHAFFNSYYLVALFLLLDIAFEYFSVNTGKLVNPE